MVAGRAISHSKSLDKYANPNFPVRNDTAQQPGFNSFQKGIEQLRTAYIAWHIICIFLMWSHGKTITHP